MGVSLDYVTTAPVTEAARRAIESETPTPPHEWWAEGMTIGPDLRGVGFLEGSTKLFLVGYDTPGGDFREVDPDDDSLMAWRDGSFIVGLLEKWSRDHGVAWVLSCAGEVIGGISGGAADANLRQFFAELVALDDGPPAEREARLREIDARHADRWD